MKVFASDGDLDEMEKMFAPIQDRDAVVVFLERKVGNRFRQELMGLDDALTHAPSGVPVVMLAWQSRIALADDPRWHAALGYPNVVFRRLPDGIVEIVAAIDEAAEQKQVSDPLAIALLDAKIFVNEMQILEHDLFSAERSPRGMATWLERARQQLGDKTQSELIEFVKQPRKENEANSRFAGQTFPDVCVDVEGTLFSDDGDFRPDVLERAQSLAAVEKRPITLWTGGDLEKIRQKVRRAGIPYKLTQKQLLRGATVGYIFDDLPQSKFFETHTIGCSNAYHQVP